MGYVFDNCPTLHECCFSVPLRPAVFVIAVLGLLWGGAFIFAFTDAGAKELADLGMPEGVADVMRYVHGALGVLLVAVHLLLLAAAIFESDSLCEVYLWFMVVFWVVLVVAALVVAVAAIIDQNYAFAGIYFLVMIVFLLISIYFAMIVGNYRMTVP